MSTNAITGWLDGSFSQTYQAGNNDNKTLGVFQYQKTKSKTSEETKKF